MNYHSPIRLKNLLEWAWLGTLPAWGGLRSIGVCQRIAESLDALKGHGFSRAIEGKETVAALAAEGILIIEGSFPQGLKPGVSLSQAAARLKPCPFKTAFVFAACIVFAVSTQALAQTPAEPVVLDRVVAVVNNQAILASDLDDEIRLSVLDPARGGLGVLTREGALDQLISRTLIQQQIREEDIQTVEPSTAEVNDRLGEIRKELPACVHKDCASDAGWQAFLIAHGLTPERVQAYLRYRIEILRFIEERFRQGIQIPHQDIQTYYNETLLPQYTKGEAIPPLDQVAPRIQEILLQQRVNVLFDGWLENLRKQGEIEVLDPALESPVTQTSPQASPQSETQPGADSGRLGSQGGGIQ
jgi:hypothetical protein